MSDSIDFVYNLIKEKGIIPLSDCQGSCPCGHFYIRGIDISFHCWRSGDGCDCEFSGIHLRPRYDFNYSTEDLVKLGKLCVESISEVWNNTDWEYKIYEN